jgi:hypothetical protein
MRGAVYVVRRWVANGPEVLVPDTAVPLPRRICSVCHPAGYQNCERATAQGVAPRLWEGRTTGGTSNRFGLRLAHESGVPEESRHCMDIRGASSPDLAAGALAAGGRLFDQVIADRTRQIGTELILAVEHDGLDSDACDAVCEAMRADVPALARAVLAQLSALLRDDGAP